MRHIVLITLIIITTGFIYAQIQNEYHQPKEKYAQNMILLQLTSKANSQISMPEDISTMSNHFGLIELDNTCKSFGDVAIRRAHIGLKDKRFEQEHGVDRWYMLSYQTDIDVLAAIKVFKQLEGIVQDASPEYIFYSQFTPNDTYFPNNWGHNNTAQLPVYQGNSHSGAGVGTIGFDAKIQLAWDDVQGMGSSSVVIAIIDGGVDTAHQDLRLVEGYDFGDNDSNPMDNSAVKGHGTACSGVAAGIGNNGLGVAGSAPGCSIMPLKIANSAGTMYTTPLANALYHCGNNNVQIASLSIATEGPVEGDIPTVDIALDYANMREVSLFAASGNFNLTQISYPANHSKVISVGAASPTGQRKSPTSSDGETWWGSSYGVNIPDDKDAIDIIGPTILPTTDITGSAGYSSNRYFLWFNGTSCATPYVAGVAALLLSKNPALTVTQVRSALCSTATDMTIDGGEGWDMFTGYGFVNAYAAISSVSYGMPFCRIIDPLPATDIEAESSVYIEVDAYDPGGTITQVNFYINDVLSFTDTISPYDWEWDTAGSGAGNYTIKAVATDDEGNIGEHAIVVNLLGMPDEGFETGDFSSFFWLNNSASPWLVQSSEKYTGTLAAKSGAIGNSGNTSLSVTLNVTTDGSILFYQKVSSQNGGDYLKFYIDDVLQDQWSGAGNWERQSYAVSSGIRNFRWSYSKNPSLYADADCAWLDHIVFPPFETYFEPPQNLVTIAGNGFVRLLWEAPLVGNPTEYHVYRDGLYLASTTDLSYLDSSVSNFSTYQYQLIAIYAEGQSSASSSQQAIPTPIVNLDATLGTGISNTGTATASPINISYKSLHGQSVYTATEMNMAGVFGPIHITHLGFYVASAPLYALPNFQIRIKHTTAQNVASWQTADGFEMVYSHPSYNPLPGGYHMIELSTPFLWNGTDNIVVDTAYDLVGSIDESGSVQFTTIANGYRYIRSDTNNQSQVFSGGSISSNRPNLRLYFEPTEIEAVTLSIVKLDQGIELAWNQVTGARKYLIYKATEPYGDYILIATTSDTTYTDIINDDRGFYMVIASSNLTE